mmetsp:Transcript_121512/g.350808  ORF Transcript_121512/g.350808 Transcript_121512/m.350808 type:complete len:271 (-) Transcript_121512:1098-1910(-)
MDTAGCTSHLHRTTHDVAANGEQLDTSLCNNNSRNRVTEWPIADRDSAFRGVTWWTHFSHHHQTSKPPPSQLLSPLSSPPPSWSSCARSAHRVAVVAAAPDVADGARACASFWSYKTMLTRLRLCWKHKTSPPRGVGNTCNREAAMPAAEFGRTHARPVPSDPQPMPSMTSRRMNESAPSRARSAGDACGGGCNISATCSASTRASSFQSGAVLDGGALKMQRESQSSKVQSLKPSMAATSKPPAQPARTAGALGLGGAPLLGRYKRGMP